MNADTIHRVCIVGISASGKTEFSKYLSEKLQLPLYHMDTFYWQENWVRAPESLWLEKEKQILETSSWIIEGYLDEQYPQRLQQADIIIFLDFSGFYCVCNLIKRWWKYHHVPRHEIAVGCTDRLDFHFLKTVLFRRERAEILRALEKTATRPKAIVFKNPKELKSWIDKICVHPSPSVVKTHS